MPLTHFPNGVSSFGIPQSIGYNPISIPSINGAVWFVDATNGSDASGDGSNADSAFASITKALANAQAGDTIFIFPGTYDENLVVTTDYIAFIGAQWAGYAKPDIGATAGITLTVTAQGFMAQHCRFFGSSDVVLQQGNGFLFTDCVFDGDGNGATTALLRLVGPDDDDSFTASEGVVINCLFRGSGGFGIIFDTAAAPSGVGSTDNNIFNNVFRGNTGVDIATKDTGGAGTVYSVKGLTLAGNFFEDKNKATYIDLTTANGGAASDQTGVINNNVFASDTITTTKIKMVGTGFTFSGNIDTVGVVDGSALD